MAKVAIIGDGQTVLGFSLMGVKDAAEARTPAEAEEALERYLQDPDIGILFITAKRASWVRKTLAGVLEERAYPILVEIPEGGLPEEEPAGAEVRRADGGAGGSGNG